MKLRYKVAIAGTAALLLIASVTPQPTPASSFNPRPEGAKALFTVLKEVALPATRWRKPFHQLTHNPNAPATMFIVETPRFGGTEAMLAWVKQGNTAVVLGGHSAPEALSKRSFDAALPEAPARSLLPLRRHNTEAVRCPAQYREVCQSVQRLSLPSRGVELTEDGPWNVVAGSRKNAVLLVRELGSGQLWYAVNGALAHNEFIDAHDNFRFLFQLASRSSQIYFDEFHHGYTQPVSAAHQTRFDALLLLLALTALILVVGVISRAVRFGPPPAPLPDFHSAAREFPSVLGLLYAEHRATDALGWYLTAWKRRISRRYGFAASGQSRLLARQLVTHVRNAASEEALYGALTTLTQAQESKNDEELAQAVALLERTAEGEKA